LIGARGADGAGQVLRQAVVVSAVDQQRELAVHQVGEIGDGRFQGVHGEGDMAAVEMAAVQHPASASPSMIGLSLALFSSFSMSRRIQLSASRATPMTCGAQRIE
jgi:hypothetical protein